MKPLSNIYVLFGLVFFILTWLFTGVYQDAEFNEIHVFTKYRPTFKVNFHSPIGMEDLNVDDLSAEHKKEELAFQKFVVQHQRHCNGNSIIWYLPFVLIQLSLSFFSFGVLKVKQGLFYKKWHFLLHLLTCLIPTIVGIEFMVTFNKWYLTILSGLIILLINYSILMFIIDTTRKIKRN